MAKFKQFIDIGANLTDTMYQGIYNGSKKHEADLQRVLQRSWDAGLSKIIITGGNFDESKKALELSKTDERLYCTVGCHPTRCLEFEQESNTPEEYLANLENLIENSTNKIVALGECGLDYDRIQFCPKDIQKKYFQRQLELAAKLQIPLFLHCRNAASDLYEMLSKFSNLRGVVHSFDGTSEEAANFISLGYFIGLNGCSLKTKENLDTISSLPEDKILLETDCPWCEVRPSHAGSNFISPANIFKSVKKEKWSADCMVKSRNEPANIRQVADVVARVREVEPWILAEKVHENTMKLFFSQ